MCLSNDQKSFLEAKQDYEEAVAKANQRVNAESYPFWFQSEQGVNDYFKLSMEHRKDNGVRDKLRRMIEAKAKLDGAMIIQALGEGLPA